MSLPTLYKYSSNQHHLSALPGIFQHALRIFTFQSYGIHTHVKLISLQYLHITCHFHGIAVKVQPSGWKIQVVFTHFFQSVTNRSRFSPLSCWLEVHVSLWVFLSERIYFVLIKAFVLDKFLPTQKSSHHLQMCDNALYSWYNLVFLG